MEVEYRPRGEYAALVNPMLSDVFTNLLSNALKYARSGGKVKVEQMRRQL